MTTAASLLAMAVVIAYVVPLFVAPAVQALSAFLDNPGEFRLENAADAVGALQMAFRDAGLLGGAAAVAMMVAGVLSSAVQTQPRFILSRIAPDFSRVSLAKGLGRILGSQGIFDALKGAVKIAGAALSASLALHMSIGSFAQAGRVEPEAIPELIRTLSLRVLMFITIVMTAVAAFDFAFTRRSWRKDLRMSKQDIRDEMKESEGDPALKARFRNVARARIRRRMMANVKNATVVVANPTHYAVALRYVRAEGGAPKVVAKGKNLIALKIRELAAQNGIPVIEDKRLARSLFDNVEVDRAIPQEFYKAVAEIVIYLGARSKGGAQSWREKP